MEEFSKEVLKKIGNTIKKGIKIAFAPIIIPLLVIIGVIIILAGAVYFLNIDDGSYKEGDWSSAPYASREYTTNLEITKDRKIATKYKIQELWDKMKESNTRAGLYLNGPKELLQMMYAEMVTQYPDLRPDPDKERNWTEEFENFLEEEGEYETFGGGNSSNSNVLGNFKKYQLSDADVKGIADMCYKEQGSKEGAAAEASLMANRFELCGSTYGSITNYVQSCRWWSSARYYGTGVAPSDVVEAVKDVLVNGNRTLPIYIDEHDYRGDIASATNDGVAININDNSAYIKNKTIIKNNMGATYTFYCFPTPNSDPFGYTSQRDMVDNEESSNNKLETGAKETGYKTSLEGGIIKLKRNFVTGETVLKDGDPELEKFKKDYRTYQYNQVLKEEKYESKQRAKEKNKDNEENKDKEENKDNESSDNEEKPEKRLTFKEWMAKKGYEKNDDGTWKRKGRKITMHYVSPEKFEENIQKYRQNPTEENKEEAMKVFTLEKGKGTKKSSKVTSLSDFLFIGDSITVGLSQASLNDENKKALEGVTYKAELGKAANYWLGQISSLPSADKVKGVCVMLGVNNPGDVGSMNNLIDKLVEKYPNVNIYIQKVLPVGRAYTVLDPKGFNDTIANYNIQVQEHCEQYDNVYFIDTSEGYVNDGGFLSAEVSEPDGLHIKLNSYDQLVENILAQTTKGKKSSSNENNSSNSSGGSLEMDQDALNSDPDFTNAEAWKESDSPYNTPSLWGQCTWFAWGKFYEIYGFSPGFTGNGYSCVDELVAAHPDKFEKSDTPVNGAVFSGVGANHVGIVLSVDGDNVTIQDGNYDGVSNPVWEDAIKDWKTNTYSLSTLKSLYGGVVFGNPIGGTVSSGSQSGSGSGSGQYNIKIAKFKETTTSYSTGDSNDVNGGAFGGTTSYEMTTESINYYAMVKPYIMPFDYLWSLLVITEDRGFIFELMKTVYDSDIEITVNDNVEDRTDVTTNTYTVTEKANASGRVTVGYTYTETTPNIDGTTKNVPKNGTSTVTGSISQVSSNSYTTVKTVHTITNKVEVALTRANVWIVDYIQDYVYSEDNKTTSSATSLEDQNGNRALTASDEQGIVADAKGKVRGTPTYANLITGSVSGQRTWSKHDRKQSVETTIFTQGYKAEEKTIREKTEKVFKAKYKKDQGSIEVWGDVDVNEDFEEQGKVQNKDNNTTEDSDKKQTEGHLKASFIPEESFRYREKNFVTLLTSYKKAKSNILNVSSWLFELLENNERTADPFVDLTKYLLYKVTRSDRWGITEFDFSIFEPGEYTDVGEICGGTTEEKIWYGLRSAGYSEEAVAGVLGNVWAECGFQYTAREQGNTQAGIGIVQWSMPDTKARLEAYANSKGKTWEDLDIQIEFLIQQLKNKEVTRRNEWM